MQCISCNVLVCSFCNAAVTFRQFVGNLLFTLHRMPTLNNLYDQLSKVVADYDDCVLTCSIPFARRRRRLSVVDTPATGLLDVDVPRLQIPTVNSHSQSRDPWRRQQLTVASETPRSLTQDVPSDRPATAAITSRRKILESSPPGAAVCQFWRWHSSFPGVYVSELQQRAVLFASSISLVRLNC